MGFHLKYIEESEKKVITLFFQAPSLGVGMNETKGAFSVEIWSPVESHS